MGKPFKGLVEYMYAPTALMTRNPESRRAPTLNPRGTPCQFHDVLQRVGPRRVERVLGRVRHPHGGAQYPAVQP